MELSTLIENIRFVNYWAALWGPLALMVLDFATGYIGACIRKERDSSKMREGGGHKAAEIACILSALVVDGTLMLDVKFVYIVSAYIMLMEVVSILENAKKMLGPKTPKIVDEAVEQLHSSIFDNSVLTIEHSATEDDEDDDDDDFDAG